MEIRFLNQLSVFIVFCLFSVNVEIPEMNSGLILIKQHLFTVVEPTVLTI